MPPPTTINRRTIAFVSDDNAHALPVGVEVEHVTEFIGHVDSVYRQSDDLVCRGAVIYDSVSVIGLRTDFY